MGGLLTFLPWIGGGGGLLEGGGLFERWGLIEDLWYLCCVSQKPSVIFVLIEFIISNFLIFKATFTWPQMNCWPAEKFDQLLCVHWTVQYFHSVHLALWMSRHLNFLTVKVVPCKNKSPKCMNFQPKCPVQFEHSLLSTLFHVTI